MKQKKVVQFLPGDAVYDVLDSPVGLLILIASQAGLHAILWDTDHVPCKDAKLLSHQDKAYQILVLTKQQLTEYFQGNRKIFDLPLAMYGTDFQLKAWEELSKIPYGLTISYAEQAEKIGDKNKARAVGMANGRNPLPVVVPCHRVIGKNGQLVGFAGGMDRKVFLLQLEQQHC